MPTRVWQDSPPSVVDPLLNEAAIEPFTEPTFDPVAFLNGSLPALSLPSNFPSDRGRGQSSSLQDISTQTQTLLAQTNALNIRYASTLSQLTDEILRSGSRLAYEVEVLRGGANALHETLTEALSEDIQRFNVTDILRDGAGLDEEKQRSDQDGNSQDPEFISQLRMLARVKARLEQVINAFGEAMNWPLPPSEPSLASSLISVSAPEPGSDVHSREEKGKEFAKKARAEIVDLLSPTAASSDVEAAAARVGTLRQLSTVFKGTAEERTRTRFVDSLSKMVEDKRRQLETCSQPQFSRTSDPKARRSSSIPRVPHPGPTRDQPEVEKSGAGGGLFRNLQRLRDEIYLD